MTTTVKRYRGTTGTYVDVATRGNEILGLSLQYSLNRLEDRSGLLVRFAARSEDGSHQPFTRFSQRQQTQYRFLDDGGHKSGEYFPVIQLNKFSIPVVSPAMPPEQFKTWVQDTNTLDVIAEWLMEQIQAEGFTLIDAENFKAFVLEQIIPTPPAPKLMLEFPDLVEYQQEHQAYQQKSTSSKSSWVDDEEEEDLDDADDLVN